MVVRELLFLPQGQRGRCVPETLFKVYVWGEGERLNLDFVGLCRSAGGPSAHALSEPRRGRASTPRGAERLNLHPEFQTCGLGKRTGAPSSVMFALTTGGTVIF